VLAIIGFIWTYFLVKDEPAIDNVTYPSQENKFENTNAEAIIMTADSETFNTPLLSTTILRAEAV
jgi:hypothetical protein